MKETPITLGRPASLRQTNALSVLKLLREAGTCSRADLVRASGLSAPTITNVVSDLLTRGLIEPLGEGASSGGRPPDLIRFRADRGCLLAAQITATTLTLLLTDLNGAELGSETVSITRRITTPEAICALLVERTHAILKAHRMKRSELFALVVGVPAITDVDQGVVVSISTLDNWRSVPLRAMLQKLVPCLVMVENDLNLAALGEQHFGAARSAQNFVLLSLGRNVGAGIILNGKVHHGAHWAAGEVAYLRLPTLSRSNPTIHQFGELESILSPGSICESWTRAGGKLSKEEKAAGDASGILQKAEGGDKRAVSVIQDRAAIIADIVVNFSLILNPSLVLLGGETGRHPAILHAVKAQLEKSEFAVPEIGGEALVKTGVLWGAISLALEELPPILIAKNKTRRV